MKRLKGRGKYWVMNGKALRRLGESSTTLRFASLFCVGVAAASLWMKGKGSNGITLQLSEICLRFFKLKEEQGIITNALDSFLICGFFLLFASVSGFSVLGGMWLNAQSLLRGALMGFAVSTLYRTNTTAGLGYTAVIFMPEAVICAVAFILSCKQSKKFSLDITENGIKETGRQSRGGLWEFALKQGFSVVITVVACLFGAVLQRLFGSFFTLG